MTEIIVAIESPMSKEARALVDGSEAALRAVYEPDECFSFTAEELLDETISFYVARKDDEAVGCVALVKEDDYGEVKRLYVPHRARGLGIAKILMARLEADAKANGYVSVKLETGAKLVAAVELYKYLDYTIRGPFGEYKDHPASLFMEKAL